MATVPNRWPTRLANKKLAAVAGNLSEGLQLKSGQLERKGNPVTPTSVVVHDRIRHRESHVPMEILRYCVGDRRDGMDRLAAMTSRRIAKMPVEVVCDSPTPMGGCDAHKVDVRLIGSSLREETDQEGDDGVLVLDDDARVGEVLEEHSWQKSRAFGAAVRATDVAPPCVESFQQVRIVLLGWRAKSQTGHVRQDTRTES